MRDFSCKDNYGEKIYISFFVSFICNTLRNGLFFQYQVEEVERGERMELEIIFDIALEFFSCVFNNDYLRPF